MTQTLNQVRLYRCTTWIDFVNRVRRVGVIKNTDTWTFANEALFRGHANSSWLLESPMERNLTIEVSPTMRINLRESHGLEWYDGLCRNVLGGFRTLVRRLPGVPDDVSDDELWALGRHHGLLTPLLDWTTSPYVAAFFALTEAIKEFQHGVSRTRRPADEVFHVWGLRTWEDLTIHGEFEILTVEPHDSRRQQAQSGRFTRLRHPKWLDVRSYLEDRGCAHYLECYEVPYSEAKIALRDLHLMNISFSTLFPDLEGAALQANISTKMIEILVGVEETPIRFTSESPERG
jgi:hypothetical protein